MTLTYGGYNIGAMTGKYNVRVIPRTVEGPNTINSIAGTTEPDPLAQKKDLIVECWPLTDAQLNLLWALAQNAIDVPYQPLKYISGDVSIEGSYKITVGQSKTVIDTADRKYHGGVVLTFTQR